MSHIVLAYDGSAAAEEALKWVAVEAAAKKAEVTVVTAHPLEWEDLHPMGGYLLEHEHHLESAASPARNAVHFLAHRNVQAFPVVREGYAADVILDVASEISADMIVMGHHGRSQVGEILNGSIAHKVAKCARCPVYMAIVNKGMTQVIGGDHVPVGLE